MARVTEEHASLRADVASLEERQRSLAENRARLASQVEDFTKRQGQIGRETERLIAERAQFVTSNQELEVEKR